MATTKQETHEGIGITLRFDADEVEQIDSLVERLKKTAPLGTHVTRTQALRHAVFTGLQAGAEDAPQRKVAGRR